MDVSATKGPLSVRAYRGDAKTLLAFNLTKAASRNLAGFTIQTTPKGKSPFYIFNSLQFERPADHAQVAAEPARSSINAPIHKFRWLHVPGTAHQGTNPVFGSYRYTVTPRYFDDKQSLKPLDPTLSVSVTIEVAPFEKKKLAIGFTRGYTQSQAFVNHFGIDAPIKPGSEKLLFDTSTGAGVNAQGEHFTFEQEYGWLGFTARQRIFDILNEVLDNASLSLRVFAYDLNEPDVMDILLKLAKRGAVRIILDDASLHHGVKKGKNGQSKTPPEDQFEKLFVAAAKKKAAILRGKFGRYSHDKIFIVSDKNGPKKVLTGSTNLSVTGLYVNANHILVFDDAKVASAYAQVFDEAWTDGVSAAKFKKTVFAAKVFSFSSSTVPAFDVTFSPHDETMATSVLDGLVARVGKEGKKAKGGSVLFAVMAIGKGSGPVYPALRALHSNADIFSYGISDSPGGIFLYRPGAKRGVLATGKPGPTTLPAPFKQVPSVSGHEIHHKFVVCGFNGADPVVYCGSSNLALGGEESNGDNLLAIHDGDVATVFAIEALSLVDHYDFLDRVATKAGTKGARKATPTSKPQAAVDAQWFLSTTDKWVEKYFDPNDLRSVDRMLFA